MNLMILGESKTMTVCKECKQRIIFDIDHVWKHVDGNNNHKALPKFNVTSIPVSDATGFAGEEENIKSATADYVEQLKVKLPKAKVDETQAKMQAMKFLALNQLELNYRLAAITGLITVYSLEETDAIDNMLAEADKVAKAALAKWHSDMISESKIMMEGVEV